MGRRGRAAQPAPLKLINGQGDGRDSGGRLVKTPPPFDRGAPDPPEWLADEAKDLWRRVAPTLDRLELLKPEDAEVFAAYCTAWAVFVDAVKTYQAEGLIVTNKRSGRKAVHPAVTAAQSASRDMLRLAQEFGLTPAAELNLAKKPGDGGSGEGNPFAGGETTSA